MRFSVVLAPILVACFSFGHLGMLHGKEKACGGPLGPKRSSHVSEAEKKWQELIGSMEEQWSRLVKEDESNWINSERSFGITLPGERRGEEQPLGGPGLYSFPPGIAPGLESFSSGRVWEGPSQISGKDRCFDQAGPGFQKHLKVIRQNAARFHLDPSLIAAIIHTESSFDPLAVSEAGAVGLMQIVPRHGGRDAYAKLYGQEWTIPSEYLHSPGINIEIGSGYLSLLKRHYFGEIKNVLKNDYLAISAYNCGPTLVKRKVIDSYEINRMSPEELFLLLQRTLPYETKNYLRQVIHRREEYRQYFRGCLLGGSLVGFSPVN